MAALRRAGFVQCRLRPCIVSAAARLHATSSSAAGSGTEVAVVALTVSIWKLSAAEPSVTVVNGLPLKHSMLSAVMGAPKVIFSGLPGEPNAGPVVRNAPANVRYGAPNGPLELLNEIANAPGPMAAGPANPAFSPPVVIHNEVCASTGGVSRLNKTVAASAEPLSATKGARHSRSV